MLESLDARLLEGVLGEVEVTEAPDQPTDHAPRLGAEQVLEGGPGVVHRGQAEGSCMIGLTSMPPKRASGICAAQSSASSRESALTW